MRSRFIAAAVAAVALPLLASTSFAAPMSTSDLLKPRGAVEEARCYRYCHHYGYCGYGYKKYRCCKVWRHRCTHRYH